MRKNVKPWDYRYAHSIPKKRRVFEFGYVYSISGFESSAFLQVVGFYHSSQVLKVEVSCGFIKPSLAWATVYSCYRTVAAWR